MKKAILVFIVSFLTFGFTSSVNSDKEFDSKLVGIWKGSEKDQQYEGVEKYWIQERFKDGTYLIMFTSKQDCEVKTFVEKGKWWTKDGKFYELSEESKDIDIYQYEVVDNNSVVNFKSIKLLGNDDNTYVFSDYKVKL